MAARGVGMEGLEGRGSAVNEGALNMTEQAFLHKLSQELEQGELRFPTSMEVTMRVLEAERT